MIPKVLRAAALFVLGILTVSSSCSGNRQFWARVTCAVAGPGGAQEGVTVSFVADKVEQSGRIPYQPHYSWSAATLATGWTPENVCEFSLRYDGRSAEFVEDVRVIATVNAEGDIYTDTVVYTPVVFLNDTQSVALRIDLPTQ
ncbi:hypothetical protein FJY70_03405 [candidate division WOR-3 bacterium]|nr:hypothetical protein [candidate division WOR-3 bacterium]